MGSDAFSGPDLGGLAVPPGLRRDIAVSWWRSQMSGVRPEIAVADVRTGEFFEAHERLRRSVQPILDDLAGNLEGTNSSIVLADHRPVILDRRSASKRFLAQLDRCALSPGFDFSEGSVGTNAIGTAAVERRLVFVAAEEHYANILKHLSCYGVPLIHPVTRRLTGILDLTFAPKENHPLMPFYMREAARRIEEVLDDWASLRQRAQFDCFVQLGRRSQRAVLSTMDDALLLSRRARLLDPVDQAAILRVGTEPGDIRHGSVLKVELEDGACLPVKVHTEAHQVCFPGVVLEVLSAPALRRAGRRSRHEELPGLVGRSEAWRAFARKAGQSGRSDAPVLFRGEAGTGKAAAARALHEQCGRSDVIVLDVATVITDGQAAWLRILRVALTSHRGVILRHLQLCDARLAAAIAAEIDASKPGDRLAATFTTPVPRAPEAPGLLERFPLHLDVPALRDRRGDVALLVPFLAQRHGAGPATRFHPGAIAKLRSADFPDNVRGLERVVVDLVVTRRGDIVAGDIHTEPGLNHLTAIELAEREVIVKVLRESAGNKAAAASRLGISRPTLYRKLAAYGIDTSDTSPWPSPGGSG